MAVQMLVAALSWVLPDFDYSWLVDSTKASLPQARTLISIARPLLRPPPSFGNARLGIQHYSRASLTPPSIDIGSQHDISEALHPRCRCAGSPLLNRLGCADIGLRHHAHRSSTSGSRPPMPSAAQRTSPQIPPRSEGRLRSRR